MFDPKKYNVAEYARQIVQAVESDRDSMVEILLEEFGAKAYRQARQDAANDIAVMFRS